VIGRRGFLKGLGLAAVGATGRSLLWPIGAAGAAKAVAADGLLYRADGTRVQVSADAGVTWQLHTDFTSVYAVKGLAVDPTGAIRATLGFKGRTFGLRLGPNQVSWLTA
jgi:hypothetical protein